jgi:hypothetical protein
MCSARRDASGISGILGALAAGRLPMFPRRAFPGFTLPSTDAVPRSHKAISKIALLNSDKLMALLDQSVESKKTQRNSERLSNGRSRFDHPVRDRASAGEHKICKIEIGIPNYRSLKPLNSLLDGSR